MDSNQQFCLQQANKKNHCTYRTTAAAVDCTCINTPLNNMQNNTTTTPLEEQKHFKRLLFKDCTCITTLINRRIGSYLQPCLFLSVHLLVREIRGYSELLGAVEHLRDVNGIGLVFQPLGWAFYKIAGRFLPLDELLVSRAPLHSGRVACHHFSVLALVSHDTYSKAFGVHFELDIYGRHFKNHTEHTLRNGMPIFQIVSLPVSNSF